VADSFHQFISTNHQGLLFHSRDHKKNRNWSDWHWQIRNQIRTPEDLGALIDLSENEKQEIKKAAAVFPMAITPYYASLIDWNDPSCPIRMQCIPSTQELNFGLEEMDDPLKEEAFSPLPGLIHRYPDRVLLLVTLECSTYCRHCTRKRKVGDPTKAINIQGIDEGIKYIQNHHEIRDVLLSGGDPFFLGDQLLENIIRKIREISHVEVIRIGTRTPVVLPQRITTPLVKMLQKYHPIWINTHFNHPREFTPASTHALAKLADAGIPLGNQTVLLKGINDSTAVIKELVHLLVKNRVRPYYLYHCDYSRGIQHFRTSIAAGVEILENLIGYTSGFAIPTYVVDIPGGGGKVPIFPEYLQSINGSEVLLKNFEGTLYHLKE
jgi:lysine 2,3-aminomutase